MLLCMLVHLSDQPVLSHYGMCESSVARAQDVIESRVGKLYTAKQRGDLDATPATDAISLHAPSFQPAHLLPKWQNQRPILQS